MSFLRLGLFAVLFMGFAAGVYLAIRPPLWIDSLARPAVILLSALTGLVLGLSLFILRYLDPVRLEPYFLRLSPLLWFLIALAIQSAVFLLYIRNGFHWQNFSGWKSIRVPALAAFAVLIFVLILISATRLGLTPDPAYWGEPGVPILLWQFSLALLGGLACLLLTAKNSIPARTLSLLLPFMIWVFAVLLWLSVPCEVLTNSFYVTIDPPARQPFPYSDAGYYDSMAHSLLIGHPYQGEVPTRPLYIVFLAVMHLLFGEDYRGIITAQTMVLALIPVVLYFLGSKIHSRAAGVTAALLAIFREYTTLLVSSETRVSNTRTLLVDLPTFLFLSVACLFALRWLERRDARSAFLAGGTFGLFLLLRTQSALVLPFLFGTAILAFGLKNRTWVPGLMVFLLGLAVTVSPWLTHNYARLGQVTFDAPFQYKVIASQYAYSGNLDIQNYDFEGKSLGRVLFDFLRKDPAFVFGFIANHFLAGEVGGILALPMIEPYYGIREPVNLYWMHWNGHLAWYNLVLVVFYLALISIGLAAAWRRWRWAGLLPLAFNLGYALATAVGRFSGWRYDLPADWVPYFYLAIGFAECLGAAAAVFGARPEDLEGSIATAQNREGHPGSSGHPRGMGMTFTAVKPLLVPGLIFALLGGLPWLAELPVPPRFAATSSEDLRARLEPVSGPEFRAGIETFLAQSEAVLLEGRLLYPRYYYRGVGLASANAWPAYAVREYPRTGFMLLNRTLEDVVFPAADARPFPQAADALVLGCQRDGYIEARLVAFPESDQMFVSDRGFEPCSPP